MTAVLYLLRRFWWAIPIAALAAMLGAALIQLDRTSAKLILAHSAQAQTIAGYRLAAAQAARDDAENVASVKAEQAAINERTVDDLQTRLADSGARYDRLRAQAAAYSGRTSEPDLSATREAACVAYAATRCDQIPALLKAAQDNTDQLLALIDWTTAQANVSTDGR